MGLNEYDAGAPVTMEVTFRNKAGVAGDPTTVVLTVKAPDGTTSTPSVTNEAALGAFSAQVSATTEGTWHYRWVGTGNEFAGAREHRFYVRRSAFV
jgi:hypothetical protein